MEKGMRRAAAGWDVVTFLSSPPSKPWVPHTHRTAAAVAVVKDFGPSLGPGVCECPQLLWRGVGCMGMSQCVHCADRLTLKQCMQLPAQRWMCCVDCRVPRPSLVCCCVHCSQLMVARMAQLQCPAVTFDTATSSYVKCDLGTRAQDSPKLVQLLHCLMLLVLDLHCCYVRPAWLTWTPAVLQMQAVASTGLQAGAGLHPGCWERWN